MTLTVNHQNIDPQNPLNASSHLKVECNVEPSIIVEHLFLNFNLDKTMHNEQHTVSNGLTNYHNLILSPIIYCFHLEPTSDFYYF